MPPTPPTPKPRHSLREKVESLVERLGASKMNPVLMEMLSEMVFMDQQRAEARTLLSSLLIDAEQAEVTSNALDAEIAKLKAKLGERTVEQVADEIVNGHAELTPVPIDKGKVGR